MATSEDFSNLSPEEAQRKIAELNAQMANLRQQADNELAQAKQGLGLKIEDLKAKQAGQ